MDTISHLVNALGAGIRSMQTGSAMSETRLRANLESVRDRIARAARRSGRDPRQIMLVGVTKQRPVQSVTALVDLGLRDLGENYPQELWKKVDAAGELPVRWHLIGHLQSNKAKRTLPLVHMIHAVDSLKLLQALDGLAAGVTRPAEVCLQVNCSGEVSKHGWSTEAVLEDAAAIAACRKVPIVGVMTMAALGTTPDQARPAFAQLRDTRDSLRERTGLDLPALSMGMSNDFEVAIEEGATLVRVGSALFEGTSP
jgi:pyridoxal phosphate enzyme (YggS family)